MRRIATFRRLSPRHRYRISQSLRRKKMKSGMRINNRPLKIRTASGTILIVKPRMNW